MIYFLIAIFTILLIVLLFRILSSNSIITNEFERLVDRKIDVLKEDIRRYENANNALKLTEWQANNEFLIRKSSVLAYNKKLSQKLAEETNIFKQNLNFNPKDIRFVGKFIDLVVFDGVAEEKEVSIYFINIKNKKGKIYDSYNSKIKNAVKADILS